MRGYRGFPNKSEYQKYYSDPSLYGPEIQSMDDYAREAEEERTKMTQSLLGTMRDVFPKHGVQIQIQQDGLVIWVNIDGVCVLRILNNGLTIPIEILDERK